MQAATSDTHWIRWASTWNRFWFAPSDPIVLGAIRVLTGAIAFYTLLAYTPDLQGLMGEHAWLDLQLRQEQYRDAPVPLVRLSWNEGGFATLPSNKEEQRYYQEYLQKWGTPPPGAYPKSDEEAAEIDAYRLRWGVDPRQVLMKGRPVWSLWFHITDPLWMMVVHGSILVCAFCFAIGLGTRLTSVLTWFGALCYIHRAPSALFGADTMLAVLLLYLAVGPSGAALSVDRWLARWRARRQGLPEPPLAPSVSGNFTVRLIQIHTCIIYAAAGLAKLQGATWWTGIATWGTLANFEYSPMQVPLYVDFLRFLARNRAVFEITMTAGSFITLAFEIGYAFLIWRPGFRTVWLWIAVALHLGIGMFMGLRTFSLLMLAFNLAFVAPPTVHWAIRRLTSKAAAAETTPAPSAPVPSEAIARHETTPKVPVATTSVKRKR